MIKIPILMYHSISYDGFFLSINQNNFFNQLSFLKKIGYETINFDQIANAKKNNFIITFDDGYEDNLLNALPILQKFNYTATLFVISNKLGKFNDWDINHSQFKKKKLMDINGIKKWLLAGCKIGNHSTNHLNLTKLNDFELKHEILDSKYYLEETFNQNIDLFSYPYGKVNQSAYDMVKKYYKFAVSTQRSRYLVSKHNSLLLPRVPVNSNTSFYKFVIKFFTIYEDIKYKNDLSLQL